MTASQPGAVRPVPERLHTVTPRLVVADGARALTVGPTRWTRFDPGCVKTLVGLES